LAFLLEEAFSTPSCLLQLTKKESEEAGSRSSSALQLALGLIKLIRECAREGSWRLNCSKIKTLGDVSHTWLLR
jgi:hypothetical protein